MTGREYFRTRFRVQEGRVQLWQVLSKWLQRFISPDAVVLDIGAGYCDFINSIRAREKHALDVSPIAAEHAAPDVKVHVQSCADMSVFEADYFDVVFASNLFEHLPREDFLKTMSEIKRILKPKGRLIVIQPNFRYCYRSYFDDYTHVQVFTDKSLADAIASFDFRIVALYPKFLPFSLDSKLPKSPLLLKIYLSLPVKPFAGQMLLIAENQKPGAAQ